MHIIFLRILLIIWEIIDVPKYHTRSILKSESIIPHQKGPKFMMISELTCLGQY